MAMASSNHHELHFILIPLMAQGHMIPMTDIARLLARQGVTITIVTTPGNAFRFKPIIDRAAESGLQIQLLQLRFPSKEAGLPDGCENIDHVPTRELMENFFNATSMLRPALEQSLQEMVPHPSCIISDMALPWTSHTALKFGIPRFFFNGMSSFSLLCNQNLLLYKPHESVESDSEPFMVPGMPHRIQLTKSQLLRTAREDEPLFQDFLIQVREGERTSDGVVINSFYELESSYVDGYQKLMGKKAWCVGPVSLYNKEASDKADRGNKAAIDEVKCLEWLDSREVASVVYVCLGSLCPLAPSQLIEIGLALERSKRPFIWVIRQGNKNKPSQELERWFLEEGFEERTKGRGLLIRGWAPQVLILSHRAVGGFVTHCGWNSTLEGVSAGVPMITWPMFADQFYNEKLIVQILGIGIRVGVEVPCEIGCGEKLGVYVKSEEVEKAIGMLMDGGGEEGEVVRKKAREVGELAKRAVEEGGSSHLNLSLFIQDIRHQVEQKHAATINLERSSTSHIR
ncbi:UDP-glycosyltransferase 73C25-like [Macadamia integrifolia]|uniref:UDP-glycosyltransferase 73C25-like n=1 Tax=Macadamia integrifolia TaxID=60698 RepID=UPI001C4FF188|nr:UDP-glycosyltransferase 73C25-like [Macadamia integrifolia]XP_042504125.1 UDP-glycosyltransferase 73C25-like [Macadamia integrifolia]XP_042504126.1 UDP-glycosyltransferase 73C25-like [Macadamia integrifolia]XP_042504127.1 UDP-glycosyltransferase 73C25-like [Macadamia integrifolia]XP_042504128.1 UDP-glycosyltransferase 73C25-like [Macadamia integrifolia]XP_042504129.1 UDP-glycosyltransferase 73C25-like [Macadamia integrifolia]